MNAAAIPENAAGTTTCIEVSILVAPSAAAAARRLRGTALSASSAIEVTSGKIRIPITRPADAVL